VIHVGAAAPEIPQPLIDQVRFPGNTTKTDGNQLAKPGRMFIPVGESSQGISVSHWIIKSG